MITTLKLNHRTNTIEEKFLDLSSLLGQHVKSVTLTGKPVAQAGRMLYLHYLDTGGRVTMPLGNCDVVDPLKTMGIAKMTREFYVGAGTKLSISMFPNSRLTFEIEHENQ